MQDLMPKFGGTELETDCQEISPTMSITTSSKRASPSNDEDDMDVPLKIMKRRIKIEK